MFIILELKLWLVLSFGVYLISDNLFKFLLCSIPELFHSFQVSFTGSFNSL